MCIGPFAELLMKRVGKLNTHFAHLNLLSRPEIRPGEAREPRTAERLESDGGYESRSHRSLRPRPIREPYRRSGQAASRAIGRKSPAACRPNTDNPAHPVC